MCARLPLPATNNPHLQVSLPLPPLFDANLSIAGLQRSSYAAPYSFSVDGRSLRRLVYLDGTLALVEFEFPLGRAELKARLVAAKASDGGDAVVAAGQLESIAYASWGLGDDLESCYAALGQDPQLAPVLARYRGMRLFRPPSLY